MQRELENIKGQMISNLNKKADYNLLEKVRENVLKKVDNDYIQNQMIKLKTDI